MANSSISNFKRFFLGVFLPYIVGCVILSYTLFFCFEREIIFKDGISGAYKIHRLTSDLSNNDIPIFGSSRAEGCYVPNIIADNCFNYGMSATGNYVWQTLLKIELSKNKETPIIINLDYNPLSAYSIGDISNYLTNTENTEIKKMLGDEYNFIYKFPVIKYMNHYMTYLKYYINNKISLTKKNIDGASFYYTQANERLFDNSDVTRRKEKIKFDADTDILELLQKTDREVFFVVAPYYSDIKSRVENLDVRDRWFNQLNELDNVHVLDYSDYQLEKQYYYDHSHFTYEGALKFTTMLKDEINKHCSL